MVDLISSNPSVEAYRAAIAEMQQRLARDQSLRTADRVENEAKVTQQGRLAGVNADNELKVLNTDLQRQTQANKIASSDLSLQTARRVEAEQGATSTGRVAGANAANAGRVRTEGEQAATSPGRVSATDASNRVTTETAGDKITSSGLGVETAQRVEGEQAATSEDRINRSHNESRLSDLNLQDQENRLFFSVIDLLDKGEYSTAIEMARQSGFEIPPEIINDRLLISQIKSLTLTAKLYYPTSPKKQADFIESAVQGMIQERQSGNMDPTQAIVTEQKNQQAQENLQNPAYPFQQEPKPEPDQVYYGNRYGGGSGGRLLKFQAVQQAAMKLGYSEADAFNIAMGYKPMTDKDKLNIASLMMAREYQGTFASAEEKQARMQQILGDLNSGAFFADLNNTAPGAAAAPGVSPTPAPAAGAGTPSVTTMKGAGSYNDPFIPTQQSDVEWFKQNAKPGQTILINGAKMSKP